MRYRALGKTGLSVSVIGCGASPLGNVFSNLPAAGDAALIGQVVEAGINFFDVSPYYGLGLAEERLGSALMPYRQSVVLATKCGRYGADQFDFSPKTIATRLEDSLRRLRTDSVDLLQAHDVEFGDLDQVVNETLPALVKLKQQGKARFIGITGYWPQFLAKIAALHPVDTILNYCHANFFCDDMDQALGEASQTEGFGLINASPLHMGLLGNGAIPAWHPAPASVREAAARVIASCRARNVDAATLGIWTCLNDTAAASTLVGLANVQQLESSCAALNLQPDKDLLMEIRAIIAPVHNLSWPQGLAQNQDVAVHSDLVATAY